MNANQNVDGSKGSDAYTITEREVQNIKISVFVVKEQVAEHIAILYLQSCDWDLEKALKVRRMT